MVIQVIVVTNMDKTTLSLKSTDTIRSAFEQAGIDYSTGAYHLGTVVLSSADYDKTFEEFGVTGKCYLMRVAKADNAR